MKTTADVFRIRCLNVILDQAQSVVLKQSLIDIIDENVDSLRFYYLGNKYQTKVEHVGVEHGIAVDQPLIL